MRFSIVACSLPLLAFVGACSEDGFGRVGSEIEVMPAAIDLGDTPAGVIARHPLTIKNRGQVSLELESIALVAGENASSDLALELPEGLNAAGAKSLLPQEEVDVTITHVPRDGVLDNGILRIVSDDADEPSLDVPIAQNASGKPIVRVVRDFDIADVEADTARGISASVEAIVFGEVPLGVRQSDTVFVVNAGSGNVPLEIVSVQLIDAPAELSIAVDPEVRNPVFLPRLGNASRSAAIRNVKVALNWLPVAQGVTLAATLRITTTVPEQPTLDIPITGGVPAGAPPQIRIEPGAGLALQGIMLHQPVDGTFEIFNDGQGTLVIEPMAIQHDTHGAFALVEAPRRVTINAGGSERFRARFTAHSEDTATASVRINSNDPSRPSIDYPLAGTMAGGMCTPTTIDPGEPINDSCTTAVTRGTLSLGVNSVETMVWSDAQLDGDTDLDWARVDLSVAAGCFLSGYDIGARASMAPGENAEVCVKVGDCNAPAAEQCAHGSARVFIFPGDDVCEAYNNNLPVFVQVRFAGGQLSCRPYTLTFDAR